VRIELLNYDEEMIRSGHPIQRAVAEVESNDPVTHDLRHLVLRLVEPEKLAYFPGQYFDITVPGTEESRSFSVANTPTADSGRLEFVIRVYPDGLFSTFLDTQLSVGDRLEVVGPFGVFTLRDGRESDLVFIGGGAGMAPILSVLRALAERGSTRNATYYYGARRKRDLCFEKELYALEATLPNFRFVPALSEPDEEDGEWTGEVGLITDVVKKYESDLAPADAYVCGPPPMVEAAMEMLTSLGSPEKHIYYDKFTTTGSS
jgi:propane monooxygenase reductase subunit